MELSQKKILFFCGHYNPQNEAVSKQIQSLSALFGGGYIYSLSEFGRDKNQKKENLKPISISPLKHRFYYPFLAPFLEMKTSLCHIFYPLASAGVFIRRLGKNKIIFTSASGDINYREDMQKVSAFVFECERDREEFLEKSDDRLPQDCMTDVIFPGIDLSFWNATPPPECERKFNVLFASMPFSNSYLEARGVGVIIEIAKKLGKGFDFILPSRMPVSQLKKGITQSVPDNVIIVSEEINDMREYYAKAHCVILPFGDKRLNKSCPLSMLESLASGRPALVSENVGAGDIIPKTGAGLRVHLSATDFCNALVEMKSNYGRYQTNARAAAEKYFSMELFLARYKNLYMKLIG